MQFCYLSFNTYLPISFNQFLNFRDVVPRAPVTSCITLTSMFHIFLDYRAKSSVLFFLILWYTLFCHKGKQNLLSGKSIIHYAYVSDLFSSFFFHVLLFTVFVCVFDNIYLPSLYTEKNFIKNMSYVNKMSYVNNMTCVNSMIYVNNMSYVDCI